MEIALTSHGIASRLTITSFHSKIALSPPRSKEHSMKNLACDSLVSFINPLLKEGKKHLLFRGERLASRTLIPKVGRVKDTFGKYITESVEKTMLTRFLKRASGYNVEIPLKITEALMVAQHHGLPTRLLDFTTNPLVALFFSVERFSKDSDGDSVVYVYDETTFDWADTIEDPFKITKNVVLSPYYLHKRMHNQQSRFMIVAKPNEEIKDSKIRKIIISCAARKTIKRELNICGVNKMNLFDSLDSVSEFIEWGMTDSH